MKYFLNILFFILILLTSCKDGSAPEIEEEEAPLESILPNLVDSLETGIALEIEPLILNPDTLPPPDRIKAGKPYIDTANKNIHPISAPDIKLVAPILPTFTPGTGKTELPESIKIKGKDAISKFSKAVPANSPSFKDNASYNLQYLDVDHGMSSSYIMSIIEDRRGNIWLASWTSGVTMYDGKTFTYFQEGEGLISNYIWVIFEDSKGRIWFGSDGTGAGIYDGNNFINYSLSEEIEPNQVYDIDEDPDGNIWFATAGGAIKFDGDEFTTYTTKNGLSHNQVNCLDVDEKGNVWMATGGAGIVRFDGESFIRYSEEEGLVSNYVNEVFVDRDDNVWIGTDGAGVCLYDGYSFFTYGVEQGMSGNIITSILEDKEGNLWFGTAEGGVSRFNRSSFIHYSESEGLSNNRVESTLEDSDGNIWIGTYGAGINKYNEKSFINFTSNQGLSGDIVRCITEDRNGNLWFGQNDGISKYTGDIFEHYGVDQGIYNPMIRSMIMDHEGNFWLGTTGSGATKFDGEYFTHYGAQNGIGSDIVLSIYEDSEHNIWFGTYDGGVTKYDGEKFYRFTEENGLANNTILSVTEDLEGNIWFGTNCGGAEKWDGKTLTHITSEQGLDGNCIQSLYVDMEGNLWIGMDGSGLNYISEDTVINYNMDEGLSNDIVYSVVEDFDGNIWASTEKGLNLITFDENRNYQVTNFGKLDGLKGVDFFPNSVFFDSEGKLWWGSGKALVMLNLNKYEKITDPPEVSITDITIEQSFIDYRTLKDSIDLGYEFHLKNKQQTDVSGIKFDSMIPFSNCPKNLELPYNLNHVTFHFSAIDWSAPHKIRYQYKLEGLDPEWSPVLTENWANYSNIPYGNYTFKVRAIGEAELWSDVVEYELIIHPPWWFTWWAYILYTVLGVLLLFLIIRWRTQTLLENQRILEQTVHERTMEVVQQKELVESKNKEITDSITYAKRIQEAILPPHEYVNEKLSNSFILYKPKDIVAGDFYWLEEKEDKLLLASADCTGHGVPGAMVSVVCNNALNRTVREFNLESPAEILDKVREIVIDTFSQHKADVKDGMDIALISLNTKTLELEYAGANNSLYLFSDGQLKVVKADKQPIGKYRIVKDFTNHKIQLKKGDTFYIFTDGYVDQFGGDKGKKLKYKPFLDILANIQKMSMEDQKQYIDDVFTEWMGRYEQIDDVCVIGVRI